MALSFAVIGVISLVARDFVLYQEPVPASIPWRATLACFSGALMLTTAVVAHPTHRDPWVNLFISTALSAAAWAVAGSYVLSYVSSRESPHRAEA